MSNREKTTWERLPADLKWFTKKGSTRLNVQSAGNPVGKTADLDGDERDLDRRRLNRSHTMPTPAGVKTTGAAVSTQYVKPGIKNADARCSKRDPGPGLSLNTGEDERG
ncbi:uncharacterized protein N7487_000519 [Penicillium crustosum]|uniref:uncharacterized protein n=1 Tax=Penicillium crustosum TaxID=36656 RepID=UPI002395337D|nr:uncharacterized protein N7487_000519 [Penicillium crustosum]KAJ5416969.1 hypothetical protein N7487_000519 [Penicillium crustosum]